MLKMRALLVAGLAFCAACQMSDIDETSRAAFVQPTNLSEAVQWLQSEGFEVLRIDREQSDMLLIVSRNNTNERQTAFNSVTFEVMEDSMVPIGGSTASDQEQNGSNAPTANALNGNSNGNAAVAVTTQSVAGNSVALAGASGRGDAVTATASTSVEQTIVEDTGTSEDGATSSTTVISSEVSATSSVSTKK